MAGAVKEEGARMKRARHGAKWSGRRRGAGHLEARDCGGTVQTSRPAGDWPFRTGELGPPPLWNQFTDIWHETRSSLQCQPPRGHVLRHVFIPLRSKVPPYVFFEVKVNTSRKGSIRQKQQPQVRKAPDALRPTLIVSSSWRAETSILQQAATPAGIIP